MTIRPTFFLLIVFLMALTADALANEGAESNPEVNPCVLTHQILAIQQPGRFEQSPNTPMASIRQR